MQEQVEELKQVVRKEVFTNAADDSSHQLKLIDEIQRLGVAYHFESEIDQALERIHETYQDIHDGGDLYNVALRFRLLRRHGYNVSCGGLSSQDFYISSLTYMSINFKPYMYFITQMYSTSSKILMVTTRKAWSLIFLVC